MKKVASKAMWTVGVLLAGAAPAYANNPPAPDGAFSLLLVVPIVIIASRLAPSQLLDKSRKNRIATGIVLGLALFCSLMGTGIGLGAMLVVVGYGLWRGLQVIAGGQGRKRFALGAVVVLYSLFAGANYIAALMNDLGRARSPSLVLRNVVNAEAAFIADKRLDVNHNGIPEYGSLQQLYMAGLIPSYYLSSEKLRGYEIGVILRGDPTKDEKEFLAYATPQNYGPPPNPLLMFSLLEAVRGQRYFAIRSSAADESGVIRSADLGGSHEIIREDAMKWQPLE